MEKAFISGRRSVFSVGLLLGLLTAAISWIFFQIENGALSVGPVFVFRARIKTFCNYR